MNWTATRMRTKGLRGRPWGKHRSASELKLLEYIVLISSKYEADPEDFFSSLVEAWKHDQARCESLSIQCRKRSDDSAIFLITEDDRALAQFAVPRHVLLQTDPLKESMLSQVRRKPKPKNTNEEPKNICDLRSGMKNISLKAEVLQISKPRYVITRFGSEASVAKASIADGTGVITMPLWNNQTFSVTPGDQILVENARVVTFRGERQLRVGRNGKLNVLTGVRNAHETSAMFPHLQPSDASSQVAQKGGEETV